MDACFSTSCLLLVLLCTLHLAVPAPTPPPPHCGPHPQEEPAPLCSVPTCSAVGEDVKRAMQGLRVSVYTLSIALNQESPYGRLELVAGVDGRFGFAPAGSRRDQENCTCLYRVDVRMDRSFRTYLVSHSNGRQRLVWALPALDHSSNDTQWPAPLPLWQLAVSDHNIRSSDLASFPFTFTLSGANNVRNVVMSDGQQTYHLQHRSCDGAAILVQEATFLVTADVLH